MSMILAHGRCLRLSILLSSGAYRDPPIVGNKFLRAGAERILVCEGTLILVE